MKYLLILLVAMLSACSTVVPVTAKFPDIPERLLEKCPFKLKTVEGEAVTIIDLTKTVTINYETYHTCAVKNDAFIEWYNIQKHIFEAAGK